MKKLSILTLLLLSAGTVSAQLWDVHISTGASNGKLLPTAGSTTGGGKKYSISPPGLYLGAELRAVVSPHSSFGLGYQYSGSKYGITQTLGGSRDASYDMISLHNISGGYYWQAGVCRNHARIGGFVQLGLAYGSFSAMGLSGSSTGGDNGIGSYSYTERLTGFETIPNFWMPNTTLGFSVAPNVAGKRLGDRLALQVSATIGWRDMYASPSRYKYEIRTDTGLETGVIQYRGIPFMIQTGLSYRFFRLNGKPFEVL